MSGQRPDPLAIVPAKARQWLYLAYAVAGCVGGALVALGADGKTTLAVIGAFSPLFGGVAASNVRPTLAARRRAAENVIDPVAHPDDYDPGPSDVDSQLDGPR